MHRLAIVAQCFLGEALWITATLGALGPGMGARFYSCFLFSYFAGSAAQ
jgi:hypothetical protein